MRETATVLCILLLFGASAAENPAPAADASKAPELKVVGLALPAVETKTPADAKEEEKRQADRVASLGDAIELKMSSATDLGNVLAYATKSSATS